MNRGLRGFLRRRRTLATLCLVLALGCHSLHLAPLAPDRATREASVPTSPGKRTLRIPPYVFLADFDLDPKLPLFRELAQLRDQVQKELHLPVSAPVIQVFLFEDRPSYERFMHAKYPDLPRRRAFFVAQPRSVGGAEDLLVYTYWGNRIQEDLRHELTHALLHSVLKDVPLWLDEGLAEYFEVPPAWNGVNFNHVDQLRRGPAGPFHPDLARLEQLEKVEQMTPAEYREAWAWVHLMLHSKPEAKRALVEYLQQLRTDRKPAPLRPRLAAIFPGLDSTLQKHLARLDNGPRPAAPPPPPTVHR